MKERVFSVSGMSCQHCVMSVREAIEEIDGVSEAVVELEAETAKVTFADNVSEDDIIEAVTEEGFTIS